jgi:hypothetical protein
VELNKGCFHISESHPFIPFYSLPTLLHRLSHLLTRFSQLAAAGRNSATSAAPPGKTATARHGTRKTLNIALGRTLNALGTWLSAQGRATLWEIFYGKPLRSALPTRKGSVSVCSRASNAQTVYIYSCKRASLAGVIIAPKSFQTRMAFLFV